MSLISTEPKRFSSSSFITSFILFKPSSFSFEDGSKCFLSFEINGITSETEAVEALIFLASLISYDSVDSNYYELHAVRSGVIITQLSRVTCLSFKVCVQIHLQYFYYKILFQISATSAGQIADADL